MKDQWKEWGEVQLAWALHEWGPPGMTPEKLVEEVEAATTAANLPHYAAAVVALKLGTQPSGRELSREERFSAVALAMFLGRAFLSERDNGIRIYSLMPLETHSWAIGAALEFG
ncbi:MAG: hypothetical protein UY48_C0002G0049 [Candidatus Gottesmanbacteria bacterium GW2011_GWB1_49_7]|uniref:Uncharacterized protein n=1 Tax=Candidatus Gottesmanbacteria bacterium GW2011_GWB1_49_7 TaxID=1618448 RepID=A0A0G1W3S5_9BACT|nr:MAG: hypothetical protein UY48_C0002G0049 [Candidatus Gottesmanbacteria bacterium GW2011_GWB1_49_7]